MEVKAGAVLLSLDKRQADCLVRQAKAELDDAVIRSNRPASCSPGSGSRMKNSVPSSTPLNFRFKAACLLLARHEQELRRPPSSTTRTSKSPGHSATRSHGPAARRGEESWKS